MSEKRFEATPGRLQRARREGDVAISHELCNTAALACGLAGCVFAVAPIGALAHAALLASARGEPSFGTFAALALWTFVPPVAAAGGATVAALAQTGGISFAVPKINVKKLAPAENLRRMCSRESAVTATRSLLAFVCAVFALVPVATGVAGAALHASGVPALASLAWDGALHAAFAACAVGAVFGVFDYGLQHARRRRRLRMSLDELRREIKEHDGDPLARSRRKAMHRALTKGSVTRVKEAAFVVTNPTHISVALEYRPPDVPVPHVLVVAADEGAAQVRDLAKFHGIPTVENVPLARELFARCKPGDVIPASTYVAVAEIVAALTRTGALE